MADIPAQHLSLEEIREKERLSPKTLRDADRGPQTLDGTRGPDGAAPTPSQRSPDGNRRTNR